MIALAHSNPALVAEWHPTLNGTLKPSEVTKSSRLKVWWKCPKGHEWETEIRSRSSKVSGCPVCSGKRVWEGLNDLATREPAIAAEWLKEKNGDLRPGHVTSSSHKVVWWRCTHGHEWQSSVNKRQQGRGCPVCAGKKVVVGVNDLFSANSKLANEWCVERNGELSPLQVSISSGKRVWWRCAQGHEWQAQIASRSNGASCPYCSGHLAIEGETDLATQNPSLVLEWLLEKNLPLQPTSISSKSGRKVWWRCAQGHEWQAQIASRSNGRGCPTCMGRIVLPGFNDLLTTNPDVAAEWVKALNGSLSPQEFSFGSSQKVWWKCSDGHEWKTSIASRTAGRGCPSCSLGGFSTAKPATIYFIQHKTLLAFKVGITNSDNKTSRIAKFQSVGWDVIKTWSHDSGRLILDAETVFFQWLRLERQIPRYLQKSDLTVTAGASETFSDSILASQEVITRIDEILQTSIRLED